MLLSLRIENVAVVRATEIEFSKGFIAITGETGAGKSVIINCIGLLLGAKADKELIRNGESCASVSGIFTDVKPSVWEYLGEVGVPEDAEGQLLISRTIHRDGRAIIKINGKTVNLAVLRSFAGELLNIHGQSDTSALVDSAKHIEIVDLYCDNRELLAEYAERYSALESVRRNIAEITERENERERLKEILSYQIKDIDALKLHEGEEEELVDKKVKIKNGEKITKNADFVFRALKGSEKGSVYYLLDRCVTALSQISGVVPELAERAEALRTMAYQVDDISEEVYAVLDGMEADPTETLNSIESRLDKISKLKRKYGPTVKAILEFRDKAAEELDSLENSEELLKKLTAEEERLYRSALESADRLHEIRTERAVELERGVKEILEFLDMPKVVFFASIKEQRSGERMELGRYGHDSVEFYISANRGAEAQSISKIASGGELARIMLAIKSIIADKDGVSSVIFDEIDAGVSGKTARKIGIKMLSLSKGVQLICVTHSAQIASLADVHLLISKSDVNNATETTVRTLDEDGRVRELSRILGGINVTEAQRNAAIDMLRERKNYT